MAESRAPRVLDLSRARCLSWCVRASGTPLPGAFIAFSHPNGGFSTLIWFQRADFILECDWFSFYNLFLFKKVKSSIKGSNSNQLFQILFSGTKLTSGVTHSFSMLRTCRNYPPTTARLRTGWFLFFFYPNGSHLLLPVTMPSGAHGRRPSPTMLPTEDGENGRPSSAASHPIPYRSPSSHHLSWPRTPPSTHPLLCPRAVDSHTVADPSSSCSSPACPRHAPKLCRRPVSYPALKLRHRSPVPPRNSDVGPSLVAHRSSIVPPLASPAPDAMGEHNMSSATASTKHTINLDHVASVFSLPFDHQRSSSRLHQPTVSSPQPYQLQSRQPSLS
jgi:hypothetical protein